MNIEKLMRKYWLEIEPIVSENGKTVNEWAIFSQKLGRCWGFGSTLEGAIKEWAKVNNVNISKDIT